jgi:hypothetical protein
MMVKVQFPGLDFFMTSLEVVIVSYFPDGTPHEMQRIGIDRFISECKDILAKKSNA